MSNKRRFSIVSEKDVEANRCKKFAKSTVTSTHSVEHLLKSYYLTLPGTSSPQPYENLTKQEMNNLLERFFLSCRTEDGEDYKSSTLTTMRQNLIRAIKLSHNYNISSEQEFTGSNNVFINRLKHLKTIGKGDIHHHPDISPGDLKVIVGILSPENPKELQLLVWFYLQLFFCRRGLENADILKKSHYSIKVVDGKKCLTQMTDELTKNHRERDFSRIQGGMVTETNSEKCPIKLFEAYLSKLDPSCEYLWQLPLKKYSSDGMWYQRKAGKNTIKNFMKEITNICSLATKYTNHCIRATTCTLLGDIFSDIDIQSLSGHKFLSGLSCYKRVNDNQKMKMSASICTALGLHQSEDKISVNSSEVLPPETPHDQYQIVTETTQVASPQSVTLNAQLMEELPTLNDLDLDNFIFHQECKNAKTDSTTPSIFQGCRIGNIANINIHIHPK
jgi:hypothetical protein